MTARIAHISFDSRNAHALSVFWGEALGVTENPAASPPRPISFPARKQQPASTSPPNSPFHHCDRCRSSRPHPSSTPHPAAAQHPPPTLSPGPRPAPSSPTPDAPRCSRKPRRCIIRSSAEEPADSAECHGDASSARPRQVPDRGRFPTWNPGQRRPNRSRAETQRHEQEVGHDSQRGQRPGAAVDRSQTRPDLLL